MIVPYKLGLVCLVAVLLMGGAPGAATTDEAVVKGNAVFQRIISALGGSEQVTALRSVRYRVEVMRTAQQQPVPSEVTMTYPDKLVLATFSEEGTERRVVNGSRGVVKGPHGTRPLEEARVKAFQTVFSRDLFFIVQHADAYEIRLLDPTEVDGGKLLTLQLVGRGEELRWLVDPRSFLPVRALYQDAYEGGTVDVVEVLGDYRQVDGITMYFRTERFVEGQSHSTWVVQSMEINPSIDDSIYRVE